MTDYKLTDVIDKVKLREMLAKFTEATDLAAIPCDLTGKNITEPTNFTRHCHMVRSTEIGKSCATPRMKNTAEYPWNRASR